MNSDDLTIHLAAIERDCMAKAEKRTRAMRYPFNWEWRDENGTWLADLECEVEVEVVWEGGEPSIWCDSVWLNGVDMIASKSTAVKLVGCDIAAEAERDEAIAEQAMRDAGIVWRSRGYNDPIGRFVKVRA